MTEHTAAEHALLDDMARLDDRGAAWVERFAELILEQARMLGELAEEETQ